MDWKNYFQSNFNLANLPFVAIRVIFIAIVFEFIAWWFARRIDRMTNSLMTTDAGREANWRIRRRTTLRQTPKIAARILCYAVALILVFDAFGVQVLPLSLAIASVALLCSAAVIPLLRDIGQGYAILAEDTLAVGDDVDINGHQGVVEKMTLRATWLRDDEGRTHCLSNRDVTNVVVHRRRLEDKGDDGRETPSLPPPSRPPLNQGKR